VLNTGGVAVTSDDVTRTDESMLWLSLLLQLLDTGGVAVMHDDVACTNELMLVLLLLLLNTGDVVVMSDDVTCPLKDVGIRDGFTQSPSEESG